jgi:hypothetical protein
MRVSSGPRRFSGSSSGQTERSGKKKMLQLTDAEKHRLLELARTALEEVVRLGRMSEAAEPADALRGLRHAL